MRSSLLQLAMLALATSSFGVRVCGAVTIQVETVGIPFSDSAQTGAFEVFVTGDLAGQPAIAAHQVRLAVADPASGITFDTAGITTDRSYLGPSFAPAVSVSATQLDSGDFTLSGGASLFDGAGLVHIDFTLPASLSVGLYDILLETNPQFTFLLDEDNQELDLSLANGTIRILLPGDYDWDDDVDGADFLKWQRSLGPNPDLMADGNRDELVGAGDLTVWEENFGTGLPVSTAAMVVPEPGTWSQLCAGLLFFVLLNFTMTNRGRLAAVRESSRSKHANRVAAVVSLLLDRPRRECGSRRS